MNIRHATIEDAALLAELGAKTFYDTYVKDNTPENMKLHLNNSFSEEIQLKELSQPDHVHLVVEEENTAVGYAQLILDGREEFIKGRKPLEIRRIYSSSAYIGKGVGRALMQATLEEAGKRGCDCVWLGVWEKNPRAMGFYKKWGFVEVGTHVFTVGNDPQIDFVMELML
jgi:diamine N-acetyltransferase